MTAAFLAIDMGMTNIDLVLENHQGVSKVMLSNQRGDPINQVQQALTAVSDQLTVDTRIAVTGGRYRDLPDRVGDRRLIKVDEMRSLGIGGLVASGLESGLVVSAGTGTAMVAADRLSVKHVTGSAVGGGTLMGLSNFLLNTTDPVEIDQLAIAGDASKVDIMLDEAVGGQVGRLPAHANAVNLGKLARSGDFSREDLAAGLVRLVAQVTAVIAINAADASNRDQIIMVGHMMDMPSFCKEINLVGEFYQKTFNIPGEPGYATALGALAILKSSS